MKITKTLRMALKAIFVKCGTIATDKATLLYDADELAEGIEVFVEKVDEEGSTEMIPAEDGEYVAEGFKVIVENGIIAKIVKDEEPAEEPVEELADEIVEEPVAEPIDEPEPDTVSVEERVSLIEGQMADVMKAIEAITNSFAALEQRMAEIEEKVAKIDAEPAAEPAIEEPIEEKHSRLSYLRKK